MGLFSNFLRGGLVCASLLAGRVACAQPAYQGPTGAVVFAQAQRLAAAGNKAAAAAAYEQAYAAYRSVDDSDGMIKALAAKKAIESGGAAGAAAPAAPLRPAPPRATAAPAAPAAPRPVAAAPAGAAPTQPLAGSVAGGRPLGLFFMTRYQMAFHSLEKATYYFAPGGRVFLNPTDFSAAGLAALPPSSRGTYTVAGRTMTVRWANGQPEASDLEPDATTFGWDMGIFLAVRPFASARQLLGSFEGGNSVSTGGGSAATSSSLTFRPDGTYSYSGAGTVSSTGSGSTVRGGGSHEGTGRWQLTGWILTLVDAAGQTRRSAAYPIETNDKTGQLVRFYFGDIAYKRQ